MKLATWNVNSIRAREERLLRWLARQHPDVLCLQELKAREADFPLAALEQVGYRAAVLGQATYNGVAILARGPLTAVARGLEDGVDDPQARLIAADVEGIRVVNVYVPNGATVGSDKWHYKLEWLARLRAWLEREAGRGRPLALCGDFNVAPEDRDVANPEQWRDTVLCHEGGRSALRALFDLGLSDAFRAVHPEAQAFTWWDYRQLGFPRNDGLRIDHIFVDGFLRERLRDVQVDREERKGSKPSDHAPVIARLALD